MSAYLGGHKISRYLYPPARSLYVYIENLTGFRYTLNSDGLNNTLLAQGYVLEIAPCVGMAGRKHISRMGRV